MRSNIEVVTQSRLAGSTHVPDRAFPNPWANGTASQPRSLVPSHIRASTADPCHELHDLL